MPPSIKKIFTNIIQLGKEETREELFDVFVWVLRKNKRIHDYMHRVLNKEKYTAEAYEYFRNTEYLSKFLDYYEVTGYLAKKLVHTKLYTGLKYVPKWPIFENTKHRMQRKSSIEELFADLIQFGQEDYTKWELFITFLFILKKNKLIDNYVYRVKEEYPEEAYEYFRGTEYLSKFLKYYETTGHIAEYSIYRKLYTGLKHVTIWPVFESTGSASYY